MSASPELETGFGSGLRAQLKRKTASKDEQPTLRVDDEPADILDELAWRGLVAPSPRSSLGSPSRGVSPGAG